MHWRRWLGVLAVVGVLVHAGAVVRHNTVMIAAAGGQPGIAGVDQTFAADLRLICGAAGHLAEAVLPGGDDPRGTTESCPICAGLSSAHALPPIESPSLAQPYVERTIAAIAADERVSIQRRIRPPSRAPPSLA